MSVRALPFFLVLPTLLVAQIPRIGVVDYYGVHKVPEDRIRKAAGMQEGDRLPASKGDVEERLEQVSGVVLARVEAICCTGDRAIIYIGIEERDAPHFDFRPAPTGDAALPPDAVDRYNSFLHVVADAARAGRSGEDLSEGHELSVDPAARSYQEGFVALADDNLASLRQVVRESADPAQRAMAAYLLGYVSKKSAVVDDLQLAMQDPDEAVRANAMRSLAALAVFGEAHPDAEVRVLPTWFVEMLNSIAWSDRFRAASALVSMTDHRRERTLDELRERALPALVEMARWKTLPHALPAFLLVGRVAGLPEKEIHDAWNQGDREMVIKKALDSTRRHPS